MKRRRKGSYEKNLNRWCKRNGLARKGHVHGRQILKKRNRREKNQTRRRNECHPTQQRPEIDVPHIIFVERSVDDKFERASLAIPDLDGRIKCRGHGVVGNYFQLPLDEDKRVDVPKAMQALGVTKIQYESQPGVWRALKGHSSSGKSISKFQNHQQVHFRVGGTSSIPKAVKEEHPLVDSWLVEGDIEEAYNTRVSRIVQKTQKGRMGVGIMVWVQSSVVPGLMLTCRHCVELSERGSINDKLYAFGGPITVLYLSNKYDLALCRGPVDNNSDHAFRLAEEGEEETGRQVRMLSYPWHVDMVYGLLENVGPTEVHGHICMFSPERGDMPKEVDALATYMGGFPASSGGAVTLNSRVLCGIHVGVIWHDKDEFSMPLVLGSLNNGSKNLERKDAWSDKNMALHMQLCGRKQSRHEIDDDDNASDGSFRSQITRNYCSSSHGYLATYVSSTHIEEAFQDYLEQTKKLITTPFNFSLYL